MSEYIIELKFSGISFTEIQFLFYLFESILKSRPIKDRFEAILKSVTQPQKI